jgi:hypothetical protein
MTPSGELQQATSEYKSRDAHLAKTQNRANV